MEHKHLLLMCDAKTPPNNCDGLETWISQLTFKLGMKTLIEPKAVYCNMSGNEGFTCITAIETSHIVLHSWDTCSPKKIQLDIYTCSKLDLSLIWGAISVWKPFNVQWKFYDRSNGFNLLDDEEQIRIEDNLTSNYWHFAKTMPQIPHWYTRAREWNNPSEFAEAVDLIKSRGVRELWKGNQYYVYLHIGDYKYWTMENDDVPTSDHILINRAKI